MPNNHGLLMTLTEPPAVMDEEFNAWYDTEHMAERLSITGFISARRWIRDCAPGEGRYLATYELQSPQVLETPEYLSHVGDGFTPWSRRCLDKATVFRRWACTQITPGTQAPHTAANALFVACAEVSDTHVQDFNQWYDTEHLPMLANVPGVLGARRFLASSGTPRYVALYDLANTQVIDHADWRAAQKTDWSKRMGQQVSAWEFSVWRAYP
jgi:hypothetical protein